MNNLLQFVKRKKREAKILKFGLVFEGLDGRIKFTNFEVDAAGSRKPEKELLAELVIEWIKKDLES